MLEIIGGPDRDRTDDLFHAMEARSQLRHRPTLRKDFFYSQTCGPLSQTLGEFRGYLGQKWMRVWSPGGGYRFDVGSAGTHNSAPIFCCATYFALIGNYSPTARCL
jgi:hypothetical protein